jgi:flagellar biosynthesis protein FlhB
VFVIAATFVIPLELVSTWANRDSLGDRGFAGAISAAADTSSSSSSVTGTSVVLLVLSGLVLALVTGAVAHLVSSWYADRAVSTREALAITLRCAPPLLFAWFIVHVAEAAAAVVLIVPLLFVMPLFMVVSPAITIERLGPIAGVKRSSALTRTRFSAVLGAVLLIALVDVALTIAFGLLGLAVSTLPYGWIGDVAIQAGASLVTVPFVAGATTLMYLDLRIRSEGLDLELDIAEHFASGI